MFHNFHEFLKDESGQGTAEYILILAAAVALVIVFKDKILTVIKGAAEQVGSKLNDAIPQIMDTGGK
ncbi:MAG TPA: Flp1 family type IVb pilin [Bdellovibrionota bacterium]|nr:Flp1 family type IVb pilin [Bdellovibrionota bacterium]